MSNRINFLNKSQSTTKGKEVQENAIKEQNWNNRFVFNKIPSYKVENDKNYSTIMDMKSYIKNSTEIESAQKKLIEKFSNSNNENIQVLNSLWDEIGITMSFKEAFIKLTYDLDSFMQTELIEKEISYLKKIDEILIKLTNEVALREKVISNLKNFANSLKQGNKINDNLLSEIVLNFKNLRILSINIVNHISKVREIISYSILCGKHNSDKLSAKYGYDKNYLIKMQYDLDFLKDTPLKDYFNFSELADPFLIALAERDNNNVRDGRADTKYSNTNNSLNNSLYNNNNVKSLNEINQNKKFIISISPEMGESIKKCQLIILQDMIFYQQNQLKQYRSQNHLYPFIQKKDYQNSKGKLNLYGFTYNNNKGKMIKSKLNLDLNSKTRASTSLAKRNTKQNASPYKSENNSKTIKNFNDFTHINEKYQQNLEKQNFSNGHSNEKNKNKFYKEELLAKRYLGNSLNNSNTTKNMESRMNKNNYKIASSSVPSNIKKQNISSFNIISSNREDKKDKNTKESSKIVKEISKDKEKGDEYEDYGDFDNEEDTRKPSNVKEIKPPSKKSSSFKQHLNNLNKDVEHSVCISKKSRQIDNEEVENSVNADVIKTNTEDIQEHNRHIQEDNIQKKESSKFDSINIDNADEEGKNKENSDVNDDEEIEEEEDEDKNNILNQFKSDTILKEKIVKNEKDNASKSSRKSTAKDLEMSVNNIEHIITHENIEQNISHQTEVKENTSLKESKNSVNTRPTVIKEKSKGFVNDIFNEATLSAENNKSGVDGLNKKSNIHKENKDNVSNKDSKNSVTTEPTILKAKSKGFVDDIFKEATQSAENHKSGVDGLKKKSNKQFINHNISNLADEIKEDNKDNEDDIDIDNDIENDKLKMNDEKELDNEHDTQSKKSTKQHISNKVESTIKNSDNNTIAEDDPNTPSFEFHFDFFTDSLVLLKNKYSDIKETNNEDLQIYIKLEAQVEDYLKTALNPKVIIAKNKEDNLFSGLIITSYDNSNFTPLSLELSLFSYTLYKDYKNIKRLLSQLLVFLNANLKYDQIFFNLYYKKTESNEYIMNKNFSSILKANSFKWFNLINLPDGERCVRYVHKLSGIDYPVKSAEYIESSIMNLNINHDFGFSLESISDDAEEYVSKADEEFINKFPVIYLLKDLEKYNFNCSNRELDNIDMKLLKNLSSNFVNNLNKTLDFGADIESIAKIKEIANDNEYNCNINIQSSFKNLMTQVRKIDGVDYLFNRIEVSYLAKLYFYI